MKPFCFRLERVLQWRQTALRMEEVKLRDLQMQQQGLEAARTELARRRTEARMAITGAGSVAGRELMDFEAYLNWTVREEARIASEEAQLKKAIDDQIRVLANARQRVRVIEHLKERRLGDWKAEAGREIEQLAGEMAIAQWRRRHPG